MPFYELTCEMATFAPPPPEQLSLFEALQGNASDIEAFLGVVTTAVSPVEFFAPENIERILGRKTPESP
jgi:hypothetical protein